MPFQKHENFINLHCIFDASMLFCCDAWMLRGSFVTIFDFFFWLCCIYSVLGIYRSVLSGLSFIAVITSLLWCCHSNFFITIKFNYRKFEGMEIWYGIFLEVQSTKNPTVRYRSDLLLIMIAQESIILLEQKKKIFTQQKGIICKYIFFSFCC